MIETGVRDISYPTEQNRDSLKLKKKYSSVTKVLVTLASQSQEASCGGEQTPSHAARAHCTSDCSGAILSPGHTRSYHADSHKVDTGTCCFLVPSETGNACWGGFGVHLGPLDLS